MPARTLLVISQVYVPDPSAVGQYLHDACAELVKRGNRVLVLTSAQGYDDPTLRYPQHEVRDGVVIRRLGLSSFGKRNLLTRISGQLLFLTQCLARALFMRDLGGVFVSTSPPMAPAAGLLVSWVRRVPLVYWVMDLNPDQVIAMGLMKRTSPLVRIMEVFNKLVLRRASAIITLDRFMAERVLKKADVNDKLAVMPPWPHDVHMASVSHEENPFRAKHNPENRIVFMYSGNHTTFSPLRTFLDAALRLRDDPRILFAFIGAGGGKAEIDRTVAEHAPANIISLPYQPLEETRYSLSAADVHLVSLGDAEVGIRHPCKVYGAMALRRPVLYLGPPASFIGEMVTDKRFGWQVSHGDVDRAVELIRQIASTPRAELEAMGLRARALIDAELNHRVLCDRLCTIVEQSMN